MGPRFEGAALWAGFLMSAETTYCGRCRQWKTTAGGSTTTVRMRNGTVIRQFICRHCREIREAAKATIHACRQREALRVLYGNTARESAGVEGGQGDADDTALAGINND